MDKLRVNIKYTQKPTGKWSDSTIRSEHIMEKMRLRAINLWHIKEAVLKGAKKLRGDGSIVADYRWFRVVYREFRLKDIRKIYPITVHEV